MLDAARRAVAELAASQHSAFTRSQAASLGFTHRRVATALRQGSLIEPVPNVLLIAGVAPSWHQRLMVATLAGGGHATISHRAAARLHGLDGFEADIVELSTEQTHCWHPVPGLEVSAHRVQRLPERDIVMVGGIRCTGLARTLVDLGAVVDEVTVRRALTAARRRNVSLRWVRQTAERLCRPGLTGAGPLLRQLDRIPSEGRVSDSWFEELIAMCIADPALPEVIRQYSIRDAAGRFVARTDLGIPLVRLGLEAHSREFHFGPEYEALDEDRDLRAARVGWELIYLGWYCTRRPLDVLAIVKDVVAARRAAA